METKTQKVMGFLGQALFWCVWTYGLYASIVAAGWNLAAQSAYQEVASWKDGE